MYMFVLPGRRKVPDGPSLLFSRRYHWELSRIPERVLSNPKFFTKLSETDVN